MFHLFSKSTYLVDVLTDMLDIHNHILPGIDDGAQTIEDSIAMIREFNELGVYSFICTPHIMHNYYDNTPTTIDHALKSLTTKIKTLDLEHVRLSAAAEHMIDDDFENKLKADQILTLNEDHILVEMSYLQPSINFDQSVEKVIKKGLFPVFAHPERYQYLNIDQRNYSKLKSQGLKFQLNLLALGGYYGKDVKKAALELLDKGMYDFIGSDAHNVRHLSALKEIKIKESLKMKMLQLKANNAILA